MAVDAISSPEASVGKELQSHRVVEVGRDLCRSSSPTPLIKQSHLQHIVQDPIQAIFGIFRDGDATTSPGNQLCHSHCKEVFPSIQMEFPVFHFVPVASCGLSGHHRKEPDSILLTPSLKVFVYTDKIHYQSSLLQEVNNTQQVRRKTYETLTHTMDPYLPKEW